MFLICREKRTEARCLEGNVYRLLSMAGSIPHPLWPQLRHSLCQGRLREVSSLLQGTEMVRDETGILLMR